MDAARFGNLGRRYWWLFILGALFALASYGIALRIRGSSEPATVYHSTSTVFVSEGDASPVTTASAAPIDLSRLASSYAEMIEGRLVAERLAVFLRRGAEAQSLRSRISARVVPNTQLIEVTSTGVSPEEADLLASGASNAFIALHDEKKLPGSALLYEVSPAVGVQSQGMPAAFSYGIVILVGFFSAIAVIALFDRYGERLRTFTIPAFEPRTTEEAETDGVA
ncbi:MAG TPA: hypothetical protein VIH21_05630 [Dehalococcoidia bacterium]